MTNTLPPDSIEYQISEALYHCEVNPKKQDTSVFYSLYEKKIISLEQLETMRDLNNHQTRDILNTLSKQLDRHISNRIESTDIEQIKHAYKKEHRLTYHSKKYQQIQREITLNTISNNQLKNTLTQTTQQKDKLYESIRQKAQELLVDTSNFDRALKNSDFSKLEHSVQQGLKNDKHLLRYHYKSPTIKFYANTLVKEAKEYLSLAHREHITKLSQLHIERNLYHLKQRQRSIMKKSPEILKSLMPVKQQSLFKGVEME